MKYGENNDVKVKDSVIDELYKGVGKSTWDLKNKVCKNMITGIALNVVYTPENLFGITQL